MESLSEAYRYKKKKTQTQRKTQKKTQIKTSDQEGRERRYLVAKSRASRRPSLGLLKKGILHWPSVPFVQWRAV